MFSTYSACLGCQAINQVAIEIEEPIEPQRCQRCRRELPIWGHTNYIDQRTLMALVRTCPVPVITYFRSFDSSECQAFDKDFYLAAGVLVPKFVSSVLNVGEHGGAARAFGIASLPTLILFDQGMESSRAAGPLSYDEFLRWLFFNSEHGLTFE